MIPRKQAPSKNGGSSELDLESSLTSMDWLTNLNFCGGAGAKRKKPAPIITTSESLPSSIPMAEQAPISAPSRHSQPLTTGSSSPSDTSTTNNNNLNQEQQHQYFSDIVNEELVLVLQHLKEESQDTTQRPNFSYSTMIAIALRQSKSGKLTLTEIYKWITDHFPYYKTAAPSWKNSVRHNLSFSKLFVRIQRDPSDPGKGAYWGFNMNRSSPPSSTIPVITTENSNFSTASAILSPLGIPTSAELKRRSSSSSVGKRRKSSAAMSKLQNIINKGASPSNPPFSQAIDAGPPTFSNNSSLMDFGYLNGINHRQQHTFSQDASLSGASPSTNSATSGQSSVLIDNNSSNNLYSNYALVSTEHTYPGSYFDIPRINPLELHLPPSQSAYFHHNSSLSNHNPSFMDTSFGGGLGASSSANFAFHDFSSGTATSSCDYLSKSTIGSLLSSIPPEMVHPMAGPIFSSHNNRQHQHNQISEEEEDEVFDYDKLI